MAEQGLAARDVALAGRVFDIDLFDDAVIDQHRIALGADAEAIARRIQRHVDGLGEIGAAVGEKIDLAVAAGLLGPGLHDERIVDRCHGDGVDALGLERRDVVEEARHVHVRAGRCEGAGHGEQRDLLALENIVGGFRLRAFPTTLTITLTITITSAIIINA